MASDLGATLRAWRDRLSPAAAGLPTGRTRRAAGLRREELADLAGISVDYVVRLEQGRFVTPSAQVVAALARALQLTVEERDHLYRLARLVPPAPGEISDHISPGVRRMLSRLSDTAVAVFAADWQLIWHNPGWSYLLGEPSATRNFARDTFPTPTSEPGLSHWPVISQTGNEIEAAIVADLRRATGRFPGDRRLTALISDLTSGNPRFAELWSAGTVAAHRADRKTVDHPATGPLTVDCDVLTFGDTDLKIVLLTAGPPDETTFRLALTGVGLGAGRSLGGEGQRDG